ncbi:MAG: phosphoribosylglycinamide formyltransferase [Deinococcales bacterium]
MTPFPLPRPARIAVLASGRGSNLEALLRAFPAGDPVGEVRLVISNRASAAALAKAQAAGVEARHIPFRDPQAFAADAMQALDDAGIDLVCLAGFMRILPPSFVRRYQGRLLNVHPSLLPAFRGLQAQRQALDAGVRETGCTVHFVDEGVDTGGIIVQRRVPVLDGDTEETLAERIRAEEHRAFPDAVRLVLSGRATPATAEVRP